MVLLEIELEIIVRMKHFSENEKNKDKHTYLFPWRQSVLVSTETISPLILRIANRLVNAVTARRLFISRTLKVTPQVINPSLSIDASNCQQTSPNLFLYGTWYASTQPVEG